jgi:hypothetical protein
VKPIGAMRSRFRCWDFGYGIDWDNDLVDLCSPLDSPELTMDDQKHLPVAALNPDIKKAQDAILDRTVFYVDEQTFNDFLDLLDQPPVYSDRLNKLLNTKASWE